MTLQPETVADSRFKAIELWFEQQKPLIARQLGWAELGHGTFASASSDASFRRYFRWSSADFSLILMDAPPEHENCQTFVCIAELLASAGVHVPKILAHDYEQGFLVLTDLGRQTWLEYWLADERHRENPELFFQRALNTLLRIQQIDLATVTIPSYDEALLRRELELFPSWYVAKELGCEFNEQQQAWWDLSCQKLIDSALAQEQVFVHRDYMPRNLMLSEPNPAVIDFQDAVKGPVTYDAICLFKDAFISWDEALVARCLRDYWQKAQTLGVPVAADYDSFRQDYDWMGVQRHLKVIGIFARICHRDGKPRYLSDVARFFTYIEQVLQRYPELSELQQLLNSLPRKDAAV